MKGLLSRVLMVGAAAIVGLTAVGCGSSSNNDQGVAFTLNGFFSAEEGEEDAGVTGFVTPFASGIITVNAQVQNNLVGQGIRVRRFLVSYNIPGAAVSIPSTSVAVTSVLGPVECADPINPVCQVATTLPPAFKTENVAKLEFLLVPSAVSEYLILNRDSLPALPFQLEVTITVEGVTTSGDTLRSNEGNLTIEYLSDDGVGSPTPAAANFEG